MDVLTDVLALDNAIGNSATEALTSLFLVTVVTGTVKETVARLDGVVDGLNSAMSMPVSDPLCNHVRRRRWTWSPIVWNDQYGQQSKKWIEECAEHNGPSRDRS